MREIPDKLIILKGKDKTNDVSDFEYTDDEIKVRIKFNDGSIYEYNAANVQIYENKKVTILKNKILFLNGSVLLNAYAIQSFGEYVRIIYDDYTFMTVNADYVAVLDIIKQLRKNKNFLPNIKNKKRTSKEVLSARRDSNPRPSPWQGDALPLSHSCI